MNGNPAYNSHFLSSWVAQCDEDAEPSRPSTPIQLPEQTPLSASSLTPSLGAATTSSQYLTYFPDSWIAYPSSSPSPSYSRISVTPTRLQSPSSIVSPETPKPWNTANSNTSPLLSPTHIPTSSDITARSSSHLSQTTLRPNSSIPSTAGTRNTSWASQTQSHDSLVRQNDVDWMKGLRNSVMVQLSPLLKQERPISQEQKNTSRQLQHTDPRRVPSWMQLQEDLQGLDLKNTNCKVDHDTNDMVDYVEDIEEDDSDEGHGDIPHRAPSVSIAYSTCASSTQ